MMARCIEALRHWTAGSQAQPKRGKPRRPQPPVFIPLIAEAWISIGTNRMRALLAMLGIIIGVASVVLMSAIGLGSQQKVEKAIRALGSNLMMVMPGNYQAHSLHANTQPALFTQKDINALAQLPSVDAVAYATYPMQHNISSHMHTVKTNVTGTIPDYFPIRDWGMADGDNFTAEDIRAGKRVAIIGATVARTLFQDESPLGQTISIGDAKLRFSVIGVLQEKGASIDGRDQDDAVFIPATVAQSYFMPYNPTSIQVIYVKGVASMSMNDVGEDVTDTLRQTQRIPPSEADNFMVMNLDAIMKVTSESTAAFSLLLGAIASISLLVGSIGIMNIMLVTVSERTREIGIRKAIGATQQQILIQFLLEAIMISTIGSSVGLALGLGGGWLAQHWFNIPAAFSLWTVIMALAMAAGIGIASGLYPAYKAARMQPIEALRVAGM